MQQETTPFFSPLPRRMEIPDEDYAQAQVCVAMADALSRTTNHSIYLIDYNAATSSTCRPIRSSFADGHRRRCKDWATPFTSR